MIKYGNTFNNEHNSRYQSSVKISNNFSLAKESLLPAKLLSQWNKKSSLPNLRLGYEAYFTAKIWRSFAHF